MADEVLKVIAENKIKELEKEIGKLRFQLKSTESFNRSAWEEYGSELCSGEMIANENAIRDDIAEVKDKIVLLERFVGGNFDLSQESYLRTQCGELDNETARIKEQKGSVVAQLEEISTIKRLLAITF